MQRSIFRYLSLCAVTLGVPLSLASCNEIDGTAGSARMFDNPDIVTMGFEGCQNLECRQVACRDNKKTTLTGRVKIPAGTLPIPGAYVYVPNNDLATIVTGPSCERCETLVSGNPVAKTQTNLDGEFVLDNVPTGEHVPLVIQVGKWRRQIDIANVTGCTSAAVDEDKTRLPRISSEGNIPKMALTTGQKDQLECLIRKLGIVDSEVTTDAGNGRVHLYAGNGGTTAFSTFYGGATLTSANNLWADSTKLNSYDVFVGSCEGQGLTPTGKTPQMVTNIYNYVNNGGRVFASHFHNYWLAQNTNWSSLVNISVRADLGDVTSTINTGFSRAAQLADWLMLPSVGGSRVRGQLDVKVAQNSILSVDPAKVDTWITVPAAQNVQYMTFDAPITAPSTQKCGRFVLSDIHVAAGDMSGVPYPNGCITTALSAQEIALIYLLFDLTTCIDPAVG